MGVRRLHRYPRSPNLSVRIPLRPVPHILPPSTIISLNPLTHNTANIPLPPNAETPLQQALSSNKSWATHTSSTNSSLLEKNSKGQSPQILWIGCSDSRVPETTILGLQPGDVFVHRNIANVLPPTDLSSQAVITYAVAHLKVKQVVVCGHTSCGGVAAALGNGEFFLFF